MKYVKINNICEIMMKLRGNSLLLHKICVIIYVQEK